MASELRVNQLQNRTGLCTVTYSDTGAIVSGIVTANSFSGGITGGAISGTTGSFSGDVSIADKIVHTGDTHTAIRFAGNDIITAEIAGTETFRIDSSGLKIASRTIAITAASPQSQLEGVGSNASSFAIICNQNASAGPVISLGKTRGTDVGGATVVQSGDSLGHISFEGSDGSNQRSGARITASVDGTPGSSDMPGRLMFFTTPDGSATEAERLRITSGGSVNIGGNYTQTFNTLNVTGNIKSTTRFNLADSVYLWQQNRMSLGNSYIIESQQNTPFAILTQAVAQPIVFGTNSTERLRIRSDGIIQIVL